MQFRSTARPVFSTVVGMLAFVRTSGYSDAGFVVGSKGWGLKELITQTIWRGG